MIPATFTQKFSQHVHRRAILFVGLGLVCGLYFLVSPLDPWSRTLATREASTLAILAFAILLWVFEIIPAYSVSLLILAFKVFLWPRLEGVGPARFEDSLQSWSSPVLWIMLAGFMISHTLSRASFARQLATRVLPLVSRNYPLGLLVVMSVTACFSMLISNTATTALILALFVPTFLSENLPLSQLRAFLVGVPAAASLGGMGTVIGSSTNAIAFEAILRTDPSFSFISWSVLTLPISMISIVGVWLLLILLPFPDATLPATHSGLVKLPELLDPEQERRLAAIFGLSVALWVFSSVLGYSVAEVSLVPIVLLSITGLVSAKEVRALPWDSLLVVMGGLLLGGLILDSGLASRVAEFLPKEHDLPWLLLSAFAFLATLLSNFMSNTAAAAILIPLALQALPDQAIAISITIALGSSAATLLPISTPPNAIAASTGLLQTRHFLKTGLFLLLLTPWLFGGLILLLL